MTSKTCLVYIENDYSFHIYRVDTSPLVLGLHDRMVNDDGDFSDEEIDFLWSLETTHEPIEGVPDATTFKHIVITGWL